MRGGGLLHRPIIPLNFARWGDLEALTPLTARATRASVGDMLGRIVDSNAA